ncbi:MAG: ABC-three component system protein, partial [Phycisphaerales bacterium]
MNRSANFNFIEEKLSILATRIEIRGGMNILDLNIHAEDFYEKFLNQLFHWKLENLNKVQQNAAGIDLVDATNKLIIQVSATSTKQKIESALAKDLSAYTNYSFKFISISKDAKKLRSQSFVNPHNLLFDPKVDIFDIPSLLNIIRDMDVDQQQIICDFLKKELKGEPDPNKIDSNLTTIIKTLSKEDWSQKPSKPETIPYDIPAKISFNQLDKAKDIIEDYKIHYCRIDKIYSDFDKQGVNKSLSILDGIRAEYIAISSVSSPDQCFFSIIKKIAEKIRASANYTPIPDEELLLCVK